MRTLTLSRALLRIVGVDHDDLGPVLSHDATQALRPFLEWKHFDLGHPIHVRELPGRLRFELTQ
jgi:hypothetical protein